MNDERRALVFAGAVSRDRSTVQVDDVADDREAEAKPAVDSSHRRIGLTEPVEDERQNIRSNPLAGVRDFESEELLVARQLQIGRAAGARELQRIRQQVPEHLLKAIGVAEGLRDVWVGRLIQSDAFGLEGRTYRIDRRAEHAADIDRLHRQRHLAA